MDSEGTDRSKHGDSENPSSIGKWALLICAKCKALKHLIRDFDTVRDTLPSQKLTFCETR